MVLEGVVTALGTRNSELEIMIREAVMADRKRISTFDPFAGDRENDIAEQRVYVFIQNRVICGYISMARGGLLGRPYVQYLAVDKSFHRIGVGTKLLGFVEELFCEDRLFISTESENYRMQNLLAKRGFVAAGEISGANLNGTKELYYFKERAA